MQFVVFQRPHHPIQATMKIPFMIQPFYTQTVIIASSIRPGDEIQEWDDDGEEQRLL